MKYLNIDLEPTQDQFQFRIRLDSNNKVYRFEFNSPSQYHQVCDWIGHMIQDQSIEFLCNGLARHLVTETKASEFDPWDIEISLVSLKRYLKQLQGEVGFTGIDCNQIICRCMKYDRQKVIDVKDKNQMSLQQFMHETNCSMICGKCRLELKDLWPLI